MEHAKHTVGRGTATHPIKWIDALDDHEDYPGQTLATRNGDVIRRWAAERHARPATGADKVDIKDGGPEVRFIFPGIVQLAPVTWADWLARFANDELVFFYEEHLPSGQVSYNYYFLRAGDLGGPGAPARKR